MFKGALTPQHESLLRITRNRNKICIRIDGVTDISLDTGIHITCVNLRGMTRFPSTINLFEFLVNRRLLRLIFSRFHLTLRTQGRARDLFGRLSRQGTTIGTDYVTRPLGHVRLIQLIRCFLGSITYHNLPILDNSGFDRLTVNTNNILGSTRGLSISTRALHTSLNLSLTRRIIKVRILMKTGTAKGHKDTTTIASTKGQRYQENERFRFLIVLGLLFRVFTTNRRIRRPRSNFVRDPRQHLPRKIRRLFHVIILTNTTPLSLRRVKQQRSQSRRHRVRGIKAIMADNRRTRNRASTNTTDTMILNRVTISTRIIIDYRVPYSCATIS